MAKKKPVITVTDQMVQEAMPTVLTAVDTKLKRLGQGSKRQRFRAKDKKKDREKTTRKFYQRFLDENPNKAGDFQSFLTWLLEHGDELIAFISKLIALFNV